MAGEVIKMEQVASATKASLSGSALGRSAESYAITGASNPDRVGGVSTHPDENVYLAGVAMERRTANVVALVVLGAVLVWAYRAGYR